MSGAALAITAVLYLATSVDQFIKGSPGMALAFLAYAVANVGFIWAMK